MPRHRRRHPRHGAHRQKAKKGGTHRDMGRRGRLRDKTKKTHIEGLGARHEPHRLESQQAQARGYQSGAYSQIPYLAVLDSLDSHPDTEPAIRANLTRRAVTDAVLEAHQLQEPLLPLRSPLKHKPELFQLARASSTHLAHTPAHALCVHPPREARV